ncbi:hypothetical protein DFJ67_0340 [Asanoa ferruginea]|uniref:Uncharacterized protein n=1 Tax=Asanoa ferruginea TaxID=53367 RepID=A0A3D9ZAR7_9ACTN|nr:hypothetical protein [Asanoa ferruginea]REF94421.1 hypothetical protein DFJ67_0340 [Asanoa ferruginea]GIF52243.1 hypothetical protein Afe04nite_67820 [Asanoa ferruginea]
MGTEPTLPLPSASEPGQFPPAIDPWSTPDLGPDPTADPSPLYPPQPTTSPPTSGPPTSGAALAQPSPAGPSPAGPFPPAADGPIVAQIGDIRVTSAMVHTPAGSFPLAGSTWHVNDFWQTEQKTPTWAIITAILGFCVLPIASLLFLLVKETIHRGTVQVTVTSGRHQYVARTPVVDQLQVQHLHQQVNYVRALAAL